MISAIIAGLHLRWDGVRQRPHHILARLASRVPVVVVEEPFIIEEQPETEEIFVEGAVKVVRPIRRRGAAMLDARTLRTAGDLVRGAQPLVWLYQPLMLEMADAFGGPLVYDCMDDLAAFAFAPPQMREFERKVLTRAAHVFCGGRTLYESRRGYGDKVKLFPSGVEFERFNAARALAPNALVDVLPRPRWGYVGVIDERLDYELVDMLAAASANVVMVGPVMKIDPAVLPRKPNVHFTGKLPYESLPSILAGLDVALMPFASNASTRSISPTKTLEYLAAGVPVVSTPVADVVADYGDVVTIATGDAFIGACERPRDGERGVDVARRHEWDAIVERMWQEVGRG